MFACWISNKEIDANFISQFNTLLKMGIENMDKAIEKESENYPHCEDPEDYLNNKISYKLDGEKRKGMELFLSKIN